MFNLTVNSTHVANSLNNTYVYNFKSGGFIVPEGSSMMCTSFTIPYSFYNISQRYNNNVLRIYWPNGAAPNYTSFTCTIPDGFYTVNTLNLFLQKFMVDNRIHSIDASGNNIFYLSMAPNTVVYGNQVLLKAIPVTLPAGVTSPTGANPSFPGLPTGTARTLYIEILNNHFSKFLGFSPGNYGQSATTDQSFVSNITPKGSTVNNLVLKCSIVNNNTTNQSDIIDVFSIGAATGGAVFGGNLNYTNDIEKWVRITTGTYNSIIFTIVDENMQDIAILDNNLLINFLIKTP
jgi:hypothetical protein